MSAYYNEIDPYAAQWLRNLISENLIAPGEVDERSIEDVRPDDLVGFTQCHFFAGVGVWSYALRLAGWPDDKPVWTGSCPCQPFSAAGKGNGFDDERHLWPSFQWLIQERRPPAIFGEQVASKAVDDWIDLVHADMEAMDYAFGCIPFPSAGIGAPHIRDRTFWVGHTGSAGLERLGRNGDDSNKSGRLDTQSSGPIAEASGALRMADTSISEFKTRRGRNRCKKGAVIEERIDVNGCGEGGGLVERSTVSNIGLAHMHSNGRNQTRECITASGDERIIRDVRTTERQPTASPVNCFWRDADWLFCRDGKWRPVRSGTFPLAHGVTNRVGRLRAYGNAINAQAAKAFIEVAMEFLP